MKSNNKQTKQEEPLKPLDQMIALWAGIARLHCKSGNSNNLTTKALNVVRTLNLYKNALENDR